MSSIGTDTESPAAFKKASLWSKTFIFTFFANFLVYFCVQGLWPIVPLYIVVMGGDERLVGLYAGAFTLVNMLMRPVSGMLLDRFDRRAVLVAGAALLALVIAGYNFASALSLLLLVRMMHGASNSLANTSITTVASGLLPPARLGEGMGLFSLSTSISIALAPAAAILVLNRAGFSGVFLANCLLAFTALFIILLSVRVIPAQQVRPQAPPSRLQWSDFFESQALPAAVIILLVNNIFGILTSFIPLFAAELGIGNSGLFFTALASTTMLSRPLAGRWADSKGADKLIAMGLILTVVSLIITSRSSGIVHLIIAGLLFGFGLTVFLPTMQALLLKKVSLARRGAAMGTFLTGFDLGNGIGAAVGGVLASTYGFRVTFLLGILPISLAALVYFLSGIGRVESRG
ncbi:MAG: MFS transporter [Firmicutes bacterium]|nr:MFS transporter [Bacillota bacterium]